MSKKKIIVIGTIALLAIIVVSLAIKAQKTYKARHGSCGQNLTWEYDGKGHLRISGTGEMWNYDRDRMPDFFRQGIDSIYIEDGVTSIGDFAFRWQANMSNVSIPATVTSIGRGAFYDCDGLTAIELPHRLTTIDDSAFLFCDGLEYIYIPSSVIYIGEEAFCDCTSLQTIRFDGSCPLVSPYDENGDFSHVSTFDGVTATVYYPANDPTWENYPAEYLGGNLTWIAY